MRQWFSALVVLAAFVLAAAFRYAVNPSQPQRIRALTAKKFRYSLSCRTTPYFDATSPDIPPMTGWGPHRWKITTRSDSAQFYFNQGINFYYAFHTLEAQASFTKAIRFDSSCAMAWYGKALALGPTINYGNGFRAEPAAFAAAQKALSLQSANTPMEKGLIAAMAIRYSTDTTTDLTKLQTAYSAAMRSLAAGWPRNADIVTLYADAVMLQHPWDLYDAGLRPRPWTAEIRSTLQKALDLDSLHPGALHFMIHTLEGSLHPEDGSAAAERLATLMPDVAHVVHMPSHIYIRSGDYKKGVDVNDEAIRGYKKYVDLYAPVQESAGLYLIHAVHMKTACAMMAGNGSLALATADTLRRLITPDILATPGGFGNFIQYANDFHLFALLRFGDWKAILLDPAPDTTLRYSVLIHHFARGIAYSHQKQFAAAEKELDALRKSQNASELKASYDPFSNAYEGSKVAEALLTGVLAGQKGENTKAKAAFETAVQAEDALIYDEPRDWPLPARQYLGALLLKTGDYKNAITVFKRDLQINPKNGWSLTGLKLAYNAQHNSAAAQRLDSELATAWQIKDRDIAAPVY